MAYQGYGIGYDYDNDVTTVDIYGFQLMAFRKQGEIKGKEYAKKYIDILVNCSMTTRNRLFLKANPYLL